MGKLLISIGLCIAFIGLIVQIFGNKFGWFGNLYGDIKIVKANYGLYFPITSMIIVSIIITIIINILSKYIK